MRRRTVLGTLALMLLPVPSAEAAESVALTVRFTDRAGAPATRADLTMLDPATGEHLNAGSDGGTATLDVAPGRYVLWATVYTGRSEASLLMWPHFTVTGSATVELDARVARPIEVRVPHPTARIAAVVVLGNLKWDGRASSASVSTADAPHISTAQLGPDEPLDMLDTRIKVNMAEPDPRTSPYLYALRWDLPGGMFTGLRETVRPEDVTEVLTDYAVLGDNRDGATGSFDGGPGGNEVISVPITLPRVRTEYYSKNTTWDSTLCYVDTCLSGSLSPRWNYGPFLPKARLIERMGNGIRIIAGIADQSGHRGLAESDIRDGRFTLHRDGVKVAETSIDTSGFRGLPPEKARYRLEYEGSFATLLPGEFHAAWTFESDHTSDVLPALDVRFTPRLDPTNHAPAARPLTLPIEVSGGQATKLAVDVSFDAGRTWQTAPVQPVGSGWVTEVTPPPGVADVSLRAHAADAAGNEVEQTMTRAIPLR